MKVNVVKQNVISNQNQISNGSYSSTPLVSMSLPKDQISFGAKSKAERMDEEYNKKGLWGQTGGWLFGGKSKTEAKVEQDMNSEANYLERQIDVANARREEQEKAQGKILQQQEEIIDSKNATIDALAKTEKANQQTIFHLNEVVESKNKLIQKTEEANKKLEALYQEQKNLVEDHKRTVQELFNKMEKAKIQNDAKLQTALKMQMEEMQKAHRNEMEELSKSIDKASQSADVFAKIRDKSNAKGFGKIAGYQEQIDTLLDHFGTPIALEKNGQAADVPSGILFFGPQGNGKTTFANAFAGQLDCELVSIRPAVEKNIDKASKKNWKNLDNVIEQAKKRFAKDRTRTIVLINEFDDFAPNGSKIVGSMKDLMDTLSKDYHCTIFATTNFPERIDKILLRDGRFYKAGLPPADKANAEAVLKHYASDFADKDVKYSELAGEIVKTQPDSAFSNARIRASVVQVVEKCKNMGKKLTHGDLSESIKKLGPDIDKVALEAFNKQLKYMAHL